MENDKTALSLGRLLRDHRLENNLLLGDLAHRLSLPPHKLSRWENDEEIPNDSQIHRIGLVLQLTDEEILTLERI